MKITSISIILILFFAVPGFTQDACPKTKSKKALNYFKDAQALFPSRKDSAKARTLALKAIDEDPEYAEAYLLAGYLALKRRDYKSALPMIEKAVELCESVDPDAYYVL